MGPMHGHMRYTLQNYRCKIRTKAAQNEDIGGIASQVISIEAVIDFVLNSVHYGTVNGGSAPHRAMRQNAISYAPAFKPKQSIRSAIL